MNKYTFHVSGTHCASCKILIEDILCRQEIIKNVQVNLDNQTVHITTDSTIDPAELARLLTDTIKQHGYTLSVDKIITKKNVDDNIWLAVPIGLLFLTLFFLLQKSGILNIGLGGKITAATSFIIGLIASVSSCLAIVGGLVLSLSANTTQDDRTTAQKTFALFHAGRMLGFAILGGLLGLIGKAIGINSIFSSILGLLASTVMILLGLNLVGTFKTNRLTLPSSLFICFKKAEHTILAPLIIGVGTFFLPCGFTQSMQIAALSSGSFISGLALMLAFAAGTFPMLALLSFGSASFGQSKYAPLFFKSAGVVVIGLGIFSLLSGLAGVGLITPLFNI